MKRTAVISLLMALCLIASGAIGPAYAQAIKRSSSTTGISSDAQIGILEKRLERLDKLNEEQTRIRQRLMTQLSELGRGIEKLKANPQRGFLADVKLQRLLSEHLKLSKEVEKTEVEIQRNREGRLFIFGQLRETYDKRLAEVVHAMTHEKDRNKALALTHRYFQLREKLKRYQTQPKPAALQVDLHHRRRDGLPHMDHFRRIMHVGGGQPADVNQAVSMHPNVRKRAKRGDVGHHAGQLHSHHEVLDAMYVFAEGELLIRRTWVTTGLKQLVLDVPERLGSHLRVDVAVQLHPGHKVTVSDKLRDGHSQI